jgi:hypothetical protein
MLPIKHKSIFKSRWIALLWAAGICWTAVEFAGGRQSDANGAADANQQQADLSAAANALDAVK